MMMIVCGKLARSPKEHVKKNRNSERRNKGKIRPFWVSTMLMHQVSSFAHPVSSGIGGLWAPQALQTFVRPIRPGALALRCIARPGMTDSPAFDDILIARVQERKQRRMIRNRVYQGGVGMLLAAALATMDWHVVCGTVITLLAAGAGFNFIVLNGRAMDNSQLVPMPTHDFEVREVAGKGKGLFSATEITKGRFLFRYGGDRIDDLEFERRYAADPFSDEAGYIMKINDDEFIDGSDPETSGLARYMNHASTPNVDKFIAQVTGAFMIACFVVLLCISSCTTMECS